MKITENPNSEIARTVKEGLKQKNGYCPCRVEKTPDTKANLLSITKKTSPPKLFYISSPNFACCKTNQVTLH